MALAEVEVVDLTDPPERDRSGDVLWALVVYVVALFGIPSSLVLAPLGAAGSPAQIIGMVMCAWWAASQLLPARGPVRRTPVHWLLLGFVVAVLASYVAGMSRPLFSGLEVNSADRGLLALFAWCGVALVISEGITSGERLRTFLRTLAIGATFVAVLGCLQFFFGLDLAHYVKIPGLSVNNTFGEIFGRSGYRRVSGTTAHPIEFGVVLSALLPLVIHFARFAPTRSQARFWWVAVCVVGASLPLSVARSAMIGGAIAVLYLFHTWPSALQRRMLVVGGAGLLGMSFVVPGLLGTIKGLFLNAGSDPSTQGRTADYAPVLRYVAESALSGRGFGTFIPGIYRTLDNQYLGLLVETGVLGVLAFVTLVVGTVVVAGQVRRRSTDDRTRDLAQCLKAGIVVIAVDAATFDALGFAVCSGLLFVFVGAVAVMSKTAPPAAAVPAAAGRRRPSAGVVAIALLLALCTVAAAHSLTRSHQEFAARGSIVLIPPQRSDETAFVRSQSATVAASVLRDVLISPQVRADVARRVGGDYEVAIGDASLMPGSDALGFGPILRVSATSPDADVAGATRLEVLAAAERQLVRIQREAGTPASEDISLRTYAADQVDLISGRPPRAVVGFDLLVFLVLAAGVTHPAVLRRVGRRGPRRGQRRTPTTGTNGTPEPAEAR